MLNEARCRLILGFFFNSCTGNLLICWFTVQREEYVQCRSSIVQCYFNYMEYHRGSFRDLFFMYPYLICHFLGVTSFCLVQLNLLASLKIGQFRNCTVSYILCFTHISFSKQKCKMLFLYISYIYYSFMSSYLCSCSIIVSSLSMTSLSTPVSIAIMLLLTV